VRLVEFAAIIRRTLLCFRAFDNVWSYEEIAAVADLAVRLFQHARTYVRTLRISPKS
jgi:hypothetical protein